MTTDTREGMIALIRIKCINANLEGYQFKVPKKIGISDMLLAIARHSEQGDVIGIRLNSYGELFLGGVTDTWDLRNDDLDRQSDSTIEFLHGLLK